MDYVRPPSFLPDRCTKSMDVWRGSKTQHTHTHTHTFQPRGLASSFFPSFFSFYTFSVVVTGPPNDKRKEREREREITRSSTHLWSNILPYLFIYIYIYILMSLHIERTWFHTCSRFQTDQPSSMIESIPNHCCSPFPLISLLLLLRLVI